MSTATPRAAAVEIALDAPLADAWRALTDPAELARWFPLSARVVPGAGGSIEWTWGDLFSWATRIEAWEPPRLLRLVQEVASPFDTQGQPVPGSEPARIMIEFTLESEAGRTTLRLVHSGFGRGAAWDDEFEGVSNGWNSGLRSLAHYLARHRGKDRHPGWATTTTGLTHAEVWQRLQAPGGFEFEGGRPGEGGRYALRTPGGERLTGTVTLHLPEREFTGTVDQLGEGLVRLCTWRAGGKTGIQLWLVTWDKPAAPHTSAFAAEARRFLGERFPSPGA